MSLIQILASNKDLNVLSVFSLPELIQYTYLTMILVQVSSLASHSSS